MTRLYFSFYYTRDRRRARHVVERWLAGAGRAATAFIPRPVLEEMVRTGVPSIYRWIDAEVARADATVVLIGAETAGRHFVEYEIAASIRHGRPLLGVRVHGLPGEDDRPDPPGRSPLFPMFPVRDWVAEDGATALPGWVDEALREQAGAVPSFEPWVRSGAISLPEE